MNRFDLFYLNARNILALSVESVLEDGKDAMESGGAFAEQSTVVDQLFGGVYHLTYKAGIYIVMVMFIVTGIGLFVASSNERGERKTKLLWGAGATIIIGGVGLIVTFLSNLGVGIFSGL